MKTKINLSSFYRNDLIAILFSFCRNNKDFHLKSEKEKNEICTLFAIDNFIIDKKLTAEKIANHLYLYIYNSEKSAFFGLLKSTIK